MRSKLYPVPVNESERNDAVRSYRIVNSPPDVGFDEITELAAQICDCPIAYISFIEGDQFWLLEGLKCADIVEKVATEGKAKSFRALESCFEIRFDCFVRRSILNARLSEIISPNYYLFSISGVGKASGGTTGLEIS
jgi:hypothetical protein